MYRNYTVILNDETLYQKTRLFWSRKKSIQILPEYFRKQ